MMKKDDQIRIRVTLAQKRRLIAAAKRAGLGVSSWLLSLGLSAAAQKLLVIEAPPGK